ncbi:MAG: hypothetical protein E7586_00395 [Ruminococcaceae bacterium]|nr:hypothetical protein [Oscillospiraceae bacterium]
MDKLYSKAALITKAVFCVCLSPLYMLLSALLTIEDGFLYLVFSIVPVVCLYTIPFWITLIFIKKYPVVKIGKYALFDCLCCFAPAVLGMVLADVAYTVAWGATNVSGIMTLIFVVIYLIITLVFVLLYFLFSYKLKSRP